MNDKKDKIVVIGLLVLLLGGIGAYFFFTNGSLSGKVSGSSISANVKSQISDTNWDSYDSNDITLNDKSIEITKEGTYTLTGEIKDGLIYINTDGNVKLILNGVSVTNSKGPAIYVENAEKVEIETVKGTTNYLEDGSSYSGYDEEIEGVIYSKDDLVLSGNGLLKIIANLGDAIVSKDDLKITSASYNIQAADDAIKGKDSVEITGGTFTIDAKGDGIKSTNDTDSSKGFILISGGTYNISANDAIDAETNINITGGTFTINALEDGIHANGLLQIDGGTINVTGGEGLEATYVKINDGTINISATDDGINAANKSSAYSIAVEINGGNITIKMGQGDTDGIDSNGNLYINGGTINITGQSPFDYDGEAKYTGGTMIVNGEKTTSISNQFGGAGGMHGGQMQGGKMNVPNGNEQRGNGNMRGGRR